MTESAAPPTSTLAPPSRDSSRPMVVPQNLASTLPPATSASIAASELILARTDLATALARLTSHERALLANVPARILTLRRATRFCSVVPVLIPGVWMVLMPRMRRMWQEMRELEDAPRVKALYHELSLLEDLPKKEQEVDPVLKGALSRVEIRWLLRLATFAPPLFVTAIVLALKIAA